MARPDVRGRALLVKEDSGGNLETVGFYKDHSRTAGHVEDDVHGAGGGVERSCTSSIGSRGIRPGKRQITCGHTRVVEIESTGKTAGA